MAQFYQFFFLSIFDCIVQNNLRYQCALRAGDKKVTCGESPPPHSSLVIKPNSFGCHALLPRATVTLDCCALMLDQSSKTKPFIWFSFFFFFFFFFFCFFLFWGADHITPVSEGGGECGLDNLRTLCVICHRKATSELNKRLKQRRILEQVAGCADISTFFRPLNWEGYHIIVSQMAKC